MLVSILSKIEKETLLNFSYSFNLTINDSAAMGIFLLHGLLIYKTLIKSALFKNLKILHKR